MEHNNRKKYEELKDLEGAVSANKNELSKVRGEITRVQNELNALQLDRTNLEGQLAAATAQKEAQQSELHDLEVTSNRLKDDNAKLEKQRTLVQAEKNAWNRSMEIWQSASASETAFEMSEKGQLLQIEASPESSATEILVSDVDPAVVSLVRQKQVLVETLADTQRLAAQLQRRYESLEERFPEQAKAFQAERDKDRSMVNQVWAKIEGEGEGV